MRGHRSRRRHDGGNRPKRRLGERQPRGVGLHDSLAARPRNAVTSRICPAWYWSYQSARPSYRATCIALVSSRRYAPGGRYWTCSTLRSASIVSSTVRRTIVSNELSAPPLLIASATAAIETLSGASHRL